MLSPLQLAAREGCVTASFLSALMAGDETKIMSEWRRLVGDPDYAPENFEDNWAVEFGSFVEDFALSWHQKKTGRELTRRGEVVHHPERPWFCCTLDSFRSDDATVIDVKAIGPFRKLDEAMAYYVPQMIGQAACTGAERAALLVIHGGQEPAEYPVEWEPDYERLVFERVDAFWDCVQRLVEPIPQTPVAPPVQPVKVYDMTGQNLWAEESGIWLENRHAARLTYAAEKELKAMVPADAVRCHGYGVQITRDRGGKLSLREMRA